MLIQILSIVCLFLAKDIACDSVEDISFLQDAIMKYSPALIKDLMTNRIEHTMEHIKSVGSSVGINQDQRSLCDIIHSSLNNLAQDIKSMDKDQVICIPKGINNFQKSMKYYITQFSLLIETFANQFEMLKTPILTQLTPDYLLNHLKAIDSSATKEKELINASLKGLAAYIEDVEIKANETTSSHSQKVFASSIVRQLRGLSNQVKDLSNQINPSNPSNYKSILTEILNQFKQYIDIFYRQFSMLAEIVTPDTVSSGVELSV
ncbi:uncharacterized protein LOC128396210 [Panonychus citri]|uniref:uncharacterized protein LOC128396210 n=1 Tax=Panonychus citri TaxID=50023 RepID=UPI002307C366|nr:uncharacterized protein LOC128396210 [Panonychus citri]